jgi:hypothetical protein
VNGGAGVSEISLTIAPPVIELLEYEVLGAKCDMVACVIVYCLELL